MDWWEFVKRDVLYGRHNDNFTELCHEIDGCLDSILTRHRSELATLMNHNSQSLNPASPLTA